VKIAIILSCFISAGIISAYHVVMSQVKSMENFYGNMDKYVSESMSPDNSVDKPYTPKPLKDMTQPLSK
jgi:type III secretory pathway component EscR